MTIRPAIIPGLVYENAQGGIAFLCEAFGFERQLVVTGDQPGQVLHAQLTLDGNMVMVSSPADTETQATPSGRSKLWIYVVMPDPDAHHARAVAAGADIVAPPHNNDYGGRGYEARDSENNVWSFGSYDPWALAH